MAKNRNLAGLAALGALGYMMARGGKKSAGEEAATIEERGTMPRSPALADSSSDFESQIREHEGGIGLQASTLGRAPAAVAPTRSMASAAATPMEVPSRGRREMLKNPQRGPAASDIAGMRAERATTDRLNDLTREMNRGQRGKIAAVGYQNPQRGPSLEEIQEKNAQDSMDALRASGGMRAKGGAIKMASGGSTSSASRRGDGIAQRGKTRGRMR